MIKLSIPVNEDAYIQKAVDHIRTSLTEKKILKKYVIEAELLSEETIILLSKHAPADSILNIRINEFMGNVSVVLCMEGERFDPNSTLVDIMGNITDEIAEESIRVIFLKAYGERYRYTHKNNVNKIRILVKKAVTSNLRSTLTALAFGLISGFLLKTLFPPAVADTVCAYALHPIKTIFMNAIRIIIAPVVFFSIVTCFSQFKNLTELGRLAAKIMAVYLFTTIIALLIGLTTVSVFKPGEWGFALTGNITPSEITQTANDDYSVLNTIVNIVPSNLVDPFLRDDTLQIMFIAVLIGIAVGMIGEYSTILSEFFEACNSLFLTITSIITRAIPVVVFCSVSLMIVEIGNASIISIFQVMVVHILSISLMLCFYGILILLVTHLNPFKFYANASESMITAFTLSSSSATLPTSIRVCIGKLGISPKICKFSIPLGATVNMDGACIYLSVFSMFLARAYGVTVTPSMLLSLSITIVLLSLGAPGIPGSSVVFLGLVLHQIGVPLEAVGLVIAINPMIDMFDTMNNITGDLAASLIVAKSENLLDIDKFNNK